MRLVLSDFSVFQRIRNGYERKRIGTCATAYHFFDMSAKNQDFDRLKSSTQSDFYKLSEILLMLLDWYVLLNVWPKSFLHAHPPAPPCIASVHHCPQPGPMCLKCHMCLPFTNKKGIRTRILSHHPLFSVQTPMPWILIQSCTHTFVNSYAYQFTHLQMSQKQYPPS